jgi:hypothetical protein
MTVATAVVAALILLIATQNPASLWAVAASPIVLLFTAVGLFIANLFGWNRLWTSEWQPEPATADHGAPSATEPSAEELDPRLRQQSSC